MRKTWPWMLLAVVLFAAGAAVWGLVAGDAGNAGSDAATGEDAGATGTNPDHPMPPSAGKEPQGPEAGEPASGGADEGTGADGNGGSGSPDAGQAIGGSSGATDGVSPDETVESGDGEGQAVNPDYAILVNGVVLPLGAWDDQYDLASLLGEPVREETRVLEHADTFTGSFEKTLSFEGLELTLFSPEQNGTTFWIMKMRLTTDTYATAAGVRVGMNVDALKSVYPDIGLAPDGRTDPDNAAYRLGGTEDSFSYDRVEFEVGNGAITEIRLYRELP